MALAGCAGETSNPGGAVGNPPNQPTRHDMASNSLYEVPAGQTFANTFEIQGQIRVGYEIRTVDNDAVDVGFVRASDLAEYREGQQVTVWAYQTNTLGTSQEVMLGTGSYAFVIHCNNSFFDCDGTYSLWSFY
jgi:hypothetical protein